LVGSGIHVLETTTNPKTHKRPAQVALARLSLKAGQSKTITLTPSGTGAGLLKRFGKLSVAITVTMTTAGKTASVKKAQPLCTRRRSRATRTLRLRPCCQRIGCSHSASPRSW
jgi:hypothetical protein